ncbi:ribulose-phosphate 3-epimerase [Soehngenia longivitae]|uniref:Ribulose-phosphate 3-epimerase n=1 Tax=Soehngenia longivitae TaxID=2562294 RepID=A0A4Z0D221_9FIRM|nr:ribulose-phosphate 3-epimerase [Soehngenia longivitae]TFZ39577.1 ribulose-phosphate 3-epimerase [Soehngenia longivitae]
MTKIAPSILSADFLNLKQEIQDISLGGADLIHLDVMDGNYVPNITFGMPIIKSIKKISSIPLDVHLMIDKPERYIDDFIDAGADILTIHAEATTHLHRTIQLIKSRGIKAGVSLNPATPLDVLEYIMDELDLILLMSVNPGFGGQSFIKAVERKIQTLKNRISADYSNVLIEVDGGIKLDNAKHIADLGADILVIGSDIFSYNDVRARTEQFKILVSE